MSSITETPAGNVADFLRLARTVPVPRLTLEEQKAILEAQADFDKWETVRDQYSKRGQNKQVDEIRRRMRECPTKVASCLAELNQLSKNAEIVCEEAKWAQVRAVSAVRDMIETALIRESAAFEAHLAQIEAIDFSNEGLSAEPLLEKLRATLADLRHRATLANRDNEPHGGQHSIRSPRQLAAGLSFSA